jgi:hypothetical protein
MLRTTCPNISVITNFGCRANCWYCIWKGHELENINEKTDWEKLGVFLCENRGKGKVSVSGGGDCLYKYHENLEWWIKFFEITSKLNIIVDVHTREKFVNMRFWEKINKCVFSSDKLDNDIEYLEWLNNFTKIRITHLVTSETTDKMIEDYLKFQNKINCEFTIKQLVKYDDGERYVNIRGKYPDIYNLDAGDYNIYYMPDNSIRTSFL